MGGGPGALAGALLTGVSLPCSLAENNLAGQVLHLSWGLPLLRQIE